MNLPAGASGQVLVVDEDSLVLEQVVAALGDAGLVCQGCRSIEAAEELASRLAPELVIVATHVCGESGVALGERLKANAAFAATAVMFLSGAQIPDIICRAHPWGGVYSLRKPFDARVLVELVDQVLRSSHRRAARDVVRVDIDVQGTAGPGPLQAAPFPGCADAVTLTVGANG